MQAYDLSVKQNDAGSFWLPYGYKLNVIFVQCKVYSVPTLLTVSIQKSSSYLLNQLIWNDFHVLSLKLIPSKVTQL